MNVKRFCLGIISITMRTMEICIACGGFTIHLVSLGLENYVTA